jgi:hypothetical protein
MAVLISFLLHWFNRGVSLIRQLILASYLGGSGSVSSEFMWDLWWTKWHWNMVFCELFQVSPANHHSTIVLGQYYKKDWSLKIGMIDPSLLRYRHMKLHRMIFHMSLMWSLKLRAQVLEVQNKLLFLKHWFVIQSAKPSSLLMSLMLEQSRKIFHIMIHDLCLFSIRCCLISDEMSEWLGSVMTMMPTILYWWHLFVLPNQCYILWSVILTIIYCHIK